MENLLNYIENKDDIMRLGNNTTFRGDGDPLDIFLINDSKEKSRKIGEVVKVEILGIFPMIDDGEIDWKVISQPCHLNERKVKNKTLSDKELEMYRLWFQHYKDKLDENNNLKSGGVVVLSNLGMGKALKVINHCIGSYHHIINSNDNYEMGMPNYNLRKTFKEL